MKTPPMPSTRSSMALEPARGAAHVLVVGGLDPTGGAGLARDLLTARALGARATLVGTAWAEQGDDGVRELAARPPGSVSRAVTGWLRGGDTRPDAVKIGMVPDAGVAAALAVALVGYTGPVVVDPVLGASRGGPLFVGTPDGLLPLLCRATLATPNADEAGRLIGMPAVRTRADALAAAARLRAAGVPAVLVKGGHLDEAEAVDVLIDAEGAEVFASPRRPGPSPRGTGCALGTAIAVALGRGQTLRDAIAGARVWLAARRAEAVPVGAVWHLP